MATEGTDLHHHISAAIDQLDEIKGGADGTTVTEIHPQAIQVLETGLKASLAVAESAMGECQKAIPFSPMRPVYKEDADHVVWCCNHNPPHCG